MGRIISKGEKLFSLACLQPPKMSLELRGFVFGITNRPDPSPASLVRKCNWDRSEFQSVQEGEMHLFFWFLKTCYY